MRYRLIFLTEWYRRNGYRYDQEELFVLMNNRHLLYKRLNDINFECMKCGSEAIERHLRNLEKKIAKSQNNVVVCDEEAKPTTSKEDESCDMGGND